MIWNWNKNNGNKYFESIIKKKIQIVKLINIKYLRYVGLWLSYNKFSIEDKYIWHRIDCVRISFIPHHQSLQNQDINSSHVLQ